MTISINKPDLTTLASNIYLLNGSLNSNDIEKAKEYAVNLIELIEIQQNLKNEWKDLLFTLANKF